MGRIWTVDGEDMILELLLMVNWEVLKSWAAKM
jgi:hypothetical protein